MDIDLFRKILKELNPIFWNAKIDRMLQESNYPNRTPIESAKWRYLIALRDLDQDQDLSAFPKSAAYRRRILYDKNPEKKRRDKLLREARECLSPLDKVYDVVQKKFTSSFAEQVLLTHEELIRNFVGTAAEHVHWTELLVCMSHKDFWSNFNSNKADAKKTTKRKRSKLKAKSKTEKAQRKPDPNEPKSKPLSISKWATIFSVSRYTMTEWKKDGKYPFEKVSARKWTLPLSSLPAEYLQKYNQIR